MSTNRLFNLSILIVLLAVVGFAVREVVGATAILADTKRTYIESNEQALRDYQLGERYGEIPSYIAEFSAEQIRRAYLLGERYGVTPDNQSKEQALLEYQSGERYGETPQEYAYKQILREYWLGERYGQIP